ncbi:phenylacetate-CoA oxygenase subunit PaaJ [Rhodococcus sp. ABRD24]|uniref:1,2-phenylacetyl-CoA epoxidase subunit PaaD n=1 Tax=Rhodococcus sp. ABRD24 TaxID=2507582 RepID=UPI00103E33C1|nr:1,2-phenylacetyl-CoA epoxidase subunit PaaD [Rhodococcus sp. ABRD24]QBJ96087.1 phenylacetate-CoA oxygenase subunit PaaJ [Rhodococcus sp. ABRD24]
MSASTQADLPMHEARRIAESVLDPEMPMLTLADLGVLRDVEAGADGAVIVTITPTYSGCPAMATMRDDIQHRLQRAGFPSVEVRTVLSPPWSTDWISDEGRRKLHENGYSTPGPAARRGSGPVPLTLTAVPRTIECPRCGSADTRLDSEFGATLCKALYRCLDCLEPFDHVKEI